MKENIKEITWEKKKTGKKDDRKRGEMIKN